MQWQIDSLATAASTNDVARERVLAAWARGELAEGIVITAARQTAGRGQHGRRWESPAGGLYFSAVAEDIPSEFRDKLALVAGVAAAEALDSPITFFPDGDGEYSPGPSGIQLRWPNDLVLGDKKVGGILCESVAMGERFAAIIGIGINVTTALEEFPRTLRGHATSLFAHDGRLRTVTGVLDAMLRRLDAALASLHSPSGFADMIARAARPRRAAWPPPHARLRRTSASKAPLPEFPMPANCCLRPQPVCSILIARRSSAWTGDAACAKSDLA